MRHRLLPTLALAGCVVLTGCVAQGKDSADNGGSSTAPSPRELLLDAKKVYDDASSVHLVLESENVPDALDSVRGAEGVGTHAPAFKGDFRARGNGLNVTVPVVAVDGKMFVKLPLTPGFRETDPAMLGTVDPATIFAKDQGLDTILTETTDVQQDGDKKRDGSNTVVMLKGNLPGAALKKVLGMGFADATYKVSYAITDPGHEIRRIEIVGPFYTKGSENTYRLLLDKFGEPVTITKP